MIIIKNLKGTPPDGKRVMFLVNQLSKLGLKFVLINNDFSSDKLLTLKDFFDSISFTH